MQNPQITGAFSIAVRMQLLCEIHIPREKVKYPDVAIMIKISKLYACWEILHAFW